MNVKSFFAVCTLLPVALAAAPVGEGLFAYYNFDALSKSASPFTVPRFFWDGEALAQSETGTLTLTSNAGATYEASVLGTRRWSGNCSLNGAYANVRLTQTVDDFIPPASGSWTLAFWFGRDSAASRPILLSNGACTTNFTATAVALDDQTADRRGFAFYSLTDSRIGFRYFSQIGEDATLGSLISTSTCTWGAAAGNVNIGWSHAAVVCEREGTGEGILTLYLNGTAQATATLPEGAAILAPTGADWKKQFNSSTNGMTAMGAENALDDIALWSRALTATEIAFIGASVSNPLTITAAQTAVLPKTYARTLTGSGISWLTPETWTINGTPNQDWGTSTVLDTVALTTAETAAEITVDTLSEIGSLTVNGTVPLTFKKGAAGQNLTIAKTTALGVNTTIDDGTFTSLGALTFTGTTLTIPTPALYTSFNLASGQTLALKGGETVTSLPYAGLFTNGGRLTVSKNVTLTDILAASAANQKLNITLLGGTLTAPRFVGGYYSGVTTDFVINGGNLKLTGTSKTFSATNGDGALFLSNYPATAANCSFRVRAGKLLVEEGVINLCRDGSATFLFATDAADSALSEARLYGIGAANHSNSTACNATFGKGTVIIGKGGINIAATNCDNKKITLSGPVTFTTYVDADLPASITGYTGWTMAASHANAFVTTASGDNAPTLDPKDKLIRISAIISGAGGLKIGSAATTGNVALDVANTYTGLTRVLGGNLLVNGIGTPGGVTVESGATLSGSGTINGPITFSDGAKLKAVKLDGNATTLTANGTITLPATPVAVDITGFGGTAPLAIGGSAKLLGWATEPAGSFTLTGKPAQTGNLILRKTATGLELVRVSGLLISLF